MSFGLIKLEKGTLKIHIWGLLRYSLLWMCVVGLWWFFRTYELFVMLTLTLLMPVISVTILWKKREAFEIKVILPAAGIGKEHTVPLAIQIYSRCLLAGFAAHVTYRVKNVFTEYSDTMKEKIWVAPGKTDVLSKTILSRHMGRVDVEVTEFAVRDWLGMCSIIDLKPRGTWVVVGPEKVEEAVDDLTLCIEDFPDENETKKRGTDINPDYEIREYLPGDDLKNIHWKLTAKTGRTMVRERLATGREKINMLLALTKDPVENDALMSSLYGMGRMLMDKGYPVRLCWLGQGNVLQGHYLAEEGELMNAIDEILSISGMKDPDMAKTVMETEYPGEAYVLVKSGKFKGSYVRQ